MQLAICMNIYDSCHVFSKGQTVTFFFIPNISRQFGHSMFLHGKHMAYRKGYNVLFIL